MEDFNVLTELRRALEGYEGAVEGVDWVRAVRFDLHFHTLLIRFHRNRRLESFYEKLLGELRMGMVLVDLRHDNPGGLAPVHLSFYQLLALADPETSARL